MPTYATICSGIEAMTAAAAPLPGWTPLWFAEIAAYPSALLSHRYPEIPNHGDLSTLPARVLAGAVPVPDVIAGGTPCQAFSLAGARHGLADARGALTLALCELLDAADAVRHAGGRPPVALLWENVDGVLSSKDNAFGHFLGRLAGEPMPLEPPGKKWSDAGYVLGPARAICWRVLDAQHFGLAQRRRRVWLVASAREDLDPGTVLLESEGMRRDSPPRRSAGEIAAALTANGVGTCGADDTQAQSFHLVPVVADIAHTLTAEGCDASEDGTGRGTPLVVQSLALRGRDGGATAELGDNLAYALRASRGGGDKPHVLIGTYVPSSHFGGVAAADISGTIRAKGADCGGGRTSGPLRVSPCLSTRTGSRQDFDTEAFAVCAHRVTGNDGAYAAGDISPCLSTLSDPSAILLQDLSLRVRRLMPVECERLQGFPDDYTLVPYRGAPARDTPRYRAIGNSWPVPVARWILRRLESALPAERSHP